MLDDIAKAYNDLLKNGSFKNISLGRSNTFSFSIPTIGKYYLECVDTLGANSTGVVTLGGLREFGFSGTDGKIYTWASSGGTVNFTTIPVKSIYNLGISLDYVNQQIGFYESWALKYTIQAGSYGSMKTLTTSLVLSNYWGSAGSVSNFKVRTRDSEFLHSKPSGFVSLHSMLSGYEVYNDKDEYLWGIQ